MRIHFNFKNDSVTFLPQPRAISHFLYSRSITLENIIDEIDTYEKNSRKYHEKVKRARERIYKRFGECNFG